ncbi:AMP-binding protein [Pseudomonas oryzae]|uniref:Long-chain acyl-CoA synthetase (AMP-forming) n=1 Tax=Pseudomonas oryzae TaxID=1392877 RepID=A0A1H1UTN3_9PSED|nr:AMP-binding protein [Pseudomonas oryzae]SDS75902.1 Long-chain acyl-CoA synthetase (AMP-forming) [Pseudomonas oryzae]
MSPVVERFWQQLASHGERIALHDGERTWSYTDLLGEVGIRELLLRQNGARRLAIALDNGPEWLFWDLAALLAGVVCVPLPGFFSPSQQRHVLDSAGIDTLVTADPHGFVALEFVQQGELCRREVPAAAPLPPGTAKITYTSGTTGQPKGVCLSAEAMLGVAQSIADATAGSGIERHLCVLPLAVLLENLAGNYAPLLLGACLETPSLASVGMRGASQFELPAFLATLARVRPSSLILLPQLLLALVGAAERGVALPDSLHFIAVGGGRVAPQLLERAEALGLPVFEGYGLSECASVVCLNTPEARRIGTVGRPLAHLEVCLADDGEVLVRGATFLGYLGDPVRPGEWLGTGDLGHWDDGFLVLHGRKKHQFVTSFGRNVNPEWVEAELVQRLPIAQAWLHGEALPANVAVLVPRGGASDAALQAAVDEVNAGLPDYARVHRWLRAAQPFGEANGLATSNGRLRRAALFDHYRQAIDCLMADSSV